MKTINVCLLSVIFMCAACAQALGQTELEKQVEDILLHHALVDSGEVYDRKARIEELSPAEQTRAVLLDMLSKYRLAEPGTREYLLLGGSIRMLGEMKERRALDPLSQMLPDGNVEKNARANAARSIGQIDAAAGKRALLGALDADYFGIRVEAAEALAKTKDPKVVKALERRSLAEKDAHVRERMEKAARDLRARIAGTR